MTRVLFDDSHGENLMMAEGSGSSFSRLEKALKKAGHAVNLINREQDFCAATLGEPALESMAEGSPLSCASACAIAEASATGCA